MPRITVKSPTSLTFRYAMTARASSTIISRIPACRASASSPRSTHDAVDRDSTMVNPLTVGSSGDFSLASAGRKPCKRHLLTPSPACRVRPQHLVQPQACWRAAQQLKLAEVNTITKVVAARRRHHSPLSVATAQYAFDAAGIRLADTATSPRFSELRDHRGATSTTLRCARRGGRLMSHLRSGKCDQVGAARCTNAVYYKRSASPLRPAATLPQPPQLVALRAFSGTSASLHSGSAAPPPESSSADQQQRLLVSGYLLCIVQR